MFLLNFLRVALPSNFFNFVKNFLAQIAILSLILEQFIFAAAAAAQTLPITADHTTNTQITKTASGIDQINIAAPNSSGLSHNRFTEYNVNQSGQIINNFSGRNSSEVAAGAGATAVTQTQIGGLVNANANLAQSGSAKVILNEVTSSNLSQILGYVEIAGSKADLIIANPNGITCSGCGFINTAHLLMVGGSSNFDAQGNLGFNLKEQANPNLYVPLITIDGLGLDVTRTSSADIIASSVKLLSSVYGSDDTALTVKTGEGRYDYANKEIAGVGNQNNDSQNNVDITKPVFAIDASNLAKIQSGRVFLIATKQGVGVKMAAEILASSTVNIDANGDVYYSAISAGDVANLKSGAKIQAVEGLDSNSSNFSNSSNAFSSSISAPNLTIQAQEFKNFGKVSAYNLTIQNSGALTNLGDIEALNLNLANIANINNFGSIYGEDSLRISGGDLTNSRSSSYAGTGSSGSIFSPQDYSVILTGLLTNDGLISSDGSLTVVANGLQNNSVAIANSINLKGEISAQNNLSFVIVGSAANSGNLIAVKDLNFTADSFSNFGVIQSGDDSAFNLASLVNAKNSSIYSAKNLSFNFNSPINLGGDNLNSLTNLGKISASQNLSITGSAAIINSNKILAGGALSLAGKGLTNNSNAIIASLGSSLALIFTGDLQNYGELNSKTNAIIAAANINNLGLIKSSAKATITADSINNQNDAQIVAGDDLAIGANLNLNNRGTIYSIGDLTTRAVNASNSGTIYSANDFILSATNFTNFGTLQSVKNSNIILSGDLVNQENSLIYSAKNLTINASGSLTNYGEISAADSSTLNFALVTNYNNIIVNNELTINAASLDNKGSGTIASLNKSLTFADSLTLTIANNLQNNGEINAAKNLTINSAIFINNGDVLSGNDLKVEATNSIVNSGNFQSANNTFILSADSLINSGIILSNGNLVLNLSNLTNSDRIISGRTFDITASENISNSATLQSADNFTINAASFTNSASALILAEKDLTITAAIINNQNTKPSTSTITSGIVSANGNITLKTDSLNNNSGIIAGKTTTLNALNAQSVNLANTLGAFISTATISLNLGAIDYTITGTITASDVDITANNITNLGNVTATDFIKLNATGDSGVVGSGNVVNGLAIGDNFNIQLAAGTYIDFTAKNNINNYAAIIGTTNTTLTATNGNVNNYSTAKITGGARTTTVNALNGSFNNTSQTSLFTADNDAIFNVKDLNNAGEISVANDLTVNASNDLNNNATALIWSGHDAVFNVANNFINDRADIYADHDLAIQKNNFADAALNKTVLVQNISGNIETYGGDIFIKAVTLENKTVDGYFNKIINAVGIDSVIIADNNLHSSYAWKNSDGGCFGHKCENVWRGYYAKQLLNPNFKSATISSGRDLNFVTTSFLNDTSTIASTGNMSINTSSFSNLASYDPGLYGFSSTWSGSTRYSSLDSITYFHCNGCGGVNRYGPQLKAADYAQSYPAFIKAGGSLVITQNGTANSSFINGNNVSQYSSIGAVSLQSRSTIINHIDTYALAETGVLNIDLSSIANAISGVGVESGSALALSLANSGSSNAAVANYATSKSQLLAPSINAGSSSSSATIDESLLTASQSGTVFAGNFKINLDGETTAPLVESRSQFTDASKFFGSSYYFDQLGLNGNEVLANIDRQTRQPTERATQILGDAFVEQKLIIDQLQTLTSDSFLLAKDAASREAQVKQMLDNSILEMHRLGLDANAVAINGLSKDQVKALTKDIITFETTTVNGIAVLAPKIYLAQSTRDRLLNNDLKTGAIGLANSATIFGKNSLTIDAANSSLTNNGSIASAGNVTIDVASLTNKTNSIAQAQIISGKNLTITANSGDIKNIGANIGAVGALALTSTNGNILNSALVRTNDKTLLNSSFGQLGGGDSYQLAAGDVARRSGNIRSVLLQNAAIRGGSVSINAANDFANLAATISATKNITNQPEIDQATANGDPVVAPIISTGSVVITAGDDVNISTLQLRNRSEISWGTRKHGGIDIKDTTANIGSTIAAEGDLNLTSTGLSETSTTANINIIGSNINIDGNGTLTSDFGNINIINATDSKMTETFAHKKGFGSSRSDQVYDYKETAVESKLNIGGNLTVSAELGTMNIIGSTIKTEDNLNIGRFTVAQNLDGSYKTNVDGTFQAIDGGSVAGVNIKAAELRSEHSESHQKSKLTLGDTLKTLANPIEMAKLELSVAKFAYTGGFGKETLEINDGPKFEKTSSRTSAAKTTQHSATLDVGGNLVVNSTGDVNVAASDVNVTGNALLNVDGNVNIVSAAETTKSSNETQSIEIGTIKLSKDMSHASGSAGVSGTGSKFEDSLTTSTQKSSNINIGGSLLANVTNNLAATDSGNLTLAVSNLTVGGDSIIKTAGNFSLTDAQDTSSYSSKASSLTIETGAKVGNAYVDAAYAWKAVVDAEKKAIQAVEKLNKMEKLKDDGRATEKAVELAAAQVVLAQVAVASATLAATAATAGAASAAGTSMGTGMYGAGYLNLTSSGVKNTTDTSLSKASNFIGYGDINIASNNNLNLLGSMLASVNGNVTLAAANDIKIEAGTNTLSQKSKQETIYGGGSVGNNGVQLNIGLSQGESDYSKTFYTNSQIGAENGTLTLNTGNDANISGANLLAKNVALNIGNNLNVSSKQTEEDFSSSGFGFNFGVGVGSGGNSGNVGGGFNMSNADMHRLWVDDITTIKGNDSMAVNVGKDLNLTGAAILSDNLALAVTGNINKKDLQDSYYSESMSLGASTSIAVGGNQATVPGTGGKPNQSPGGSTTISGSYAQNESSRSVYATIGGLDSTLTSATKDVTGGDFEGSLTLDHRLRSESGRADITKNFSQLGQNLKTMREAGNKSPLKIGAILNAPNTLLEGAIYAFAEKKNDPEGSQLMIASPDNELMPVLNATLTKNYAVNGIATDEDTGFNNYLKDPNSDVTLRYNPTHGIFGDLVESALGKVADWTGNEDAIAMNRYVKEDLQDRKDMANSMNIFHSQGSIIGVGAMQLYAKENGSENQINTTQRFVAVGPAVLKDDWKSASYLLGEDIGKNSSWQHDPDDPVRYLAAPSNLITDTASLLTNKPINSPIYIPNLITNTPQGLWDAILHMDKHDVKNQQYYKFINPNISLHQQKNNN